jgi:hypothetical protein
MRGRSMFKQEMGIMSLEFADLAEQSVNELFSSVQDPFI